MTAYSLLSKTSQGLQFIFGRHSSHRRRSIDPDYQNVSKSHENKLTNPYNTRDRSSTESMLKNIGAAENLENKRSAPVGDDIVELGSPENSPK